MIFENAMRFYHWDRFTRINREQATVDVPRKAAGRHDVSIQALPTTKMAGAQIVCRRWHG